MSLPGSAGDQEEQGCLEGLDGPDNLGAQIARLIEQNRLVPKVEDGKRGDFKEFFGAFLSEEFEFRTARGASLRKKDFVEGGPTNRDRVGYEVEVLYQSPDAVLLSTVVSTPGPDGPRYTNDRLFVREGVGPAATWRCRVWRNYPEPQAPPPSSP